MRLSLPRWSLVLALSALASGSAVFPVSTRGEIKLIGTARLSGEATDQSGLTDVLAGGIPHNRLGGISAIEYTGKEDKYLLLPDRGPGDGATAYRCRFHELKLLVEPGRTPAVTAALVATTMLENESGRPLTGSAAAFDKADPAKGLRFDPEGIRSDRRGKIFLSDEYGPGVFEFSTAGKRTNVLNVPARFRIAHPSAVAAEEAAQNKSGRQTNGGLEGLAITPDGARLYAAMQRPLIQDSQPGEAAGKRVGTNTRIIELNRVQGTTREFLYPLDDTANGVSEILAINGHEFLVLERDGRGGAEAVTKKIFKVDLEGATDITSRESLPANGVPEGVTAARKTPFLDLLAPEFGLAGSACPEKVEGLTFGPDLADGRRLLIVAIDNDFVAEKPIEVHAFAVDREDLPRFGW
jgi:hypothetical protein